MADQCKDLQDAHGRPLTALIDSLLEAETLIARYPDYLRVISFLRSDTGDTENFRLYLKQVGEAGSLIVGYEPFINFWNDRKNDHTSVIMKQVLMRLIQMTNPHKYNQIKSRSELALTEKPDKKPNFITLNLRTPYFFANHLPEMAQRLAAPSQSIESMCPECSASPLPLQGDALWDTLLSRNDPRFDRRLNYYAFFPTIKNREAYWMKTPLIPRYDFDVIYVPCDEEGFYSFIQLQPIDTTLKPTLFIGVPKKTGLIEKKPSQCFTSKLLSKVVINALKGEFNMAACRSWSLPKNENMIRKLFTIDYFRFSGDDSYSQNLFGADNGTCVLNTDTTGLGLKDSFAFCTGEQGKKLILVEQSAMFAVYNNGDTVKLCTESFHEPCSIGEVELYSADMGHPVFTDANGDKMVDIIVNGSAIILRNKDGRLVQKQFD